MRILCDDVADCLNNAEVLGRVLWLAKYSKGKLVLKDHKITPRTGCSSHAEPSPGTKHIPCEALVEWWNQCQRCHPGSDGRPQWGDWKANFCMRLVKKRKSSILACDSPAHIQWPGQMDMEDDYKTYQHKNLVRTHGKVTSCDLASGRAHDAFEGWKKVDSWLEHRAWGRDSRTWGQRDEWKLDYAEAF